MTLTDTLVKDGRKPIVLEITAADVRHSIKGDPAHCAAAVACQRILHADEVRIHKTRAYVRIGKEWRRYMVPANIYREITAFDRGASFEPGTYFLRPPGASEKLGADRGGHTETGKGRKKSRAVIVKTRNVRVDAHGGVGLYESLET
jgi:hypothetical protein